MWQSIVVLLLIAVVSVYVARHFLRVVRGRTSHCGCCSECPGLTPRQCPEGDQRGSTMPTVAPGSDAKSKTCREDRS